MASNHNNSGDVYRYFHFIYKKNDFIIYGYRQYCNFISKYNN